MYARISDLGYGLRSAAGNNGCRIVKRVLETVLFFLGWIVLLVGCGGHSSQRDELPLAHGEDLQLARGVAEDFLIFGGRSPYVYQGSELTTENLRKDFDYQKGPQAKPWYEFEVFSISSQSMNSSQTQAWVRGFVRPTNKNIGTTSFSQYPKIVGFGIRLVKHDGRWLVDNIEWGAAPTEFKSP